MALQSMVIWGVAREMKGLPTAAAPPVPRHRLIPALAARPALAVTLFILVLTVILLAVMQGPLSPDISGQLWIADRLRHGARLYIDISEINPPLWFWLAIPVDGLAAALGVRAEAVLIVAIGFAALLSLLATNQLLKTYPPELRSALLIFAACILLIMPLRDLGQREQIALMGRFPMSRSSSLGARGGGCRFGWRWSWQAALPSVLHSSITSSACRCCWNSGCSFACAANGGQFGQRRSCS